MLLTPTTIVRLATAAAVAASALVVGCHRPQGALIPYATGSKTYFSTEMIPKTVKIMDIRTGDTLFSMDIPVGKQLTLQFFQGGGDDPVYTPDLMQYEVFEMGTITGKLRSSMSVPNYSSRRIDIDIRTGVEYVTAAPEQSLRTDQLIDRPDWWTPAGGALPDNRRGVNNYDD